MDRCRAVGRLTASRAPDRVHQARGNGFVWLQTIRCATWCRGHNRRSVHGVRSATRNALWPPQLGAPEDGRCRRSINRPAQTSAGPQTRRRTCADSDGRRMASRTDRHMAVGWDLWASCLAGLFRYAEAPCHISPAYFSALRRLGMGEGYGAPGRAGGVGTLLAVHVGAALHRHALPRDALRPGAKRRPRAGGRCVTRAHVQRLRRTQRIQRCCGAVGWPPSASISGASASDTGSRG